MCMCVCGCGRYMMYIKKEDEVYMLDRDNAVFLIPNVKFPTRQNPEEHHTSTLVDGVSE